MIVSSAEPTWVAVCITVLWEYGKPGSATPHRTWNCSGICGMTELITARSVVAVMAPDIITPHGQKPGVGKRSNEWPQCKIPGADCCILLIASMSTFHCAKISAYQISHCTFLWWTKRIVFLYSLLLQWTIIKYFNETDTRSEEKHVTQVQACHLTL